MQITQWKEHGQGCLVRCNTWRDKDHNQSCASASGLPPGMGKPANTSNLLVHVKLEWHTLHAVFPGRYVVILPWHQRQDNATYLGVSPQWDHRLLEAPLRWCPPRIAQGQSSQAVHSANRKSRSMQPQTWIWSEKLQLTLSKNPLDLSKSALTSKSLDQQRLPLVEDRRWSSRVSQLVKKCTISELIHTYIPVVQQHDVHTCGWQTPCRNKLQSESRHSPTGIWIALIIEEAVAGIGTENICPSSIPPTGTCTFIVESPSIASNSYPSGRFAGAVTSIIGIADAVATDEGFPTNDSLISCSCLDTGA